MKKCIGWALAALALNLSVAGYAVSHSGGLDSKGCHHDTKNGDYHCHR